MKIVKFIILTAITFLFSSPALAHNPPSNSWFNDVLTVICITNKTEKRILVSPGFIFSNNPGTITAAGWQEKILGPWDTAGFNRGMNNQYGVATKVTVVFWEVSGTGKKISEIHEEEVFSDVTLVNECRNGSNYSIVSDGNSLKINSSN